MSYAQRLQIQLNKAHTTGYVTYPHGVRAGFKPGKPIKYTK